jgi:pectin lyase
MLNNNGRLTISNNEFDGMTQWSAACNDRHYYGLLFNGAAELITMKNNYIHHTSGRSPKIASGTLLHVVNNYWSSVAGHAFDISSGARVVAEGNYFSTVQTPLLAGSAGALFAPASGGSTACSTGLGRNCQGNVRVSSGTFDGTNTAAISAMQDRPIAAASAASTNVANIAGVGKI